MTVTLEPSLSPAFDVPLSLGEPDGIAVCRASYQQEFQYYLDQVSSSASANHIPILLRAAGRLDLTLLERSLTAIVERHEALRTTFAVLHGELVQAIAAPSRVSLELTDLRDLPAAEREHEARVAVTADLRRAFNLRTGPLFRVHAWRLSEEDHFLLLNLHHSIADGWSFTVLLRELGAAYQAYQQETQPRLPELPIQYGDYAEWQRDTLQGETLEELLGYWKGQLSGYSGVLELPADRPRPSVRSAAGDVITRPLPRALLSDLESLSQRQDCTPFMTLLTAFQVLLHRYTEQVDVAVGSPVAARNRSELEPLIGCFINTLVFRTDLSGDPSFREAMERVRETALGAYAHQELPFGLLVRALDPPRDPSRTAIVQALFQYHEAFIRPVNPPGLTFTSVGTNRGGSLADLMLCVLDQGERVICSVEYSTELFDAATVEQFMGHYQQLLEAAAANPDQPISKLPLLTSDERRQLLVEWNDTGAEYPQDRGVHELFAMQARQTPERTALVFGRDRITYAELDRRANQVAHCLQALGVGPEVSVGVYVERSLEMLMAVLGILKAGGAYVPLDPAFPAERIGWMLEDARPPVLLTQESLRAALPPHAARVICLDTGWDDIARYPSETPEARTGPDHLAYILFTSGSTGRPKGVQIEHRALVNFLESMRREPGMIANDRLLAVTTLSFDIAALELFLPLLVGACCVIASRDDVLDGGRLRNLMDEHAITVLQATPATWQLLLGCGWMGTPGLKALCGGEAVPRELATQLLERCDVVWNVYGPTETTIWSAACRIQTGDGPVTIAGPIANTQLYVLDRQMEPVPIGVPGELYIGGDGLARGYLNQDALTAERFVPNPLRGEVVAASGAASPRLYRTGDRVRYLADGRMEFLGRIDQQVKIRGYRIELGEVEAALVGHDAVRQSVAIVREDTPGDRRLVAYVVPIESGSVSGSILREHAGKLLPPYMVPTSVVVLDCFPLTPNGKIDRGALPLPDLSDNEAGDVQVAPSDAIELQLTEIWRRTLNCDELGVTDNFFDLGGHSLLAVRLFSEIETRFGLRLPLATLYRAPTIRHLAEVIRAGDEPGSWESLLVLQPRGTQPPLFLVHGGGGNVLDYWPIAKHLGTDQPVYAFQSRGLDGNVAPLTTIEEMARHYIERMRGIQPKGPYFIGGESLGGLIAYEMAQQLRTSGQRAALLALLDSKCTRSPEHGSDPAFAGSRVHRHLTQLDKHLGMLRQLPARDQLRYLGRSACRKARSLALKLVGRRIPTRFDLLPPPLRSVETANSRARRSYEPTPYPDRVTLLLAVGETTRTLDDARLTWAELAEGGLELHLVPGDHLSMVTEPNVQVLTARLRDCLIRARSESAS